MDPLIDPRIIPWSHRGSYLCLATRSGQNGRLTTGHDVCLVSHRHPAGLPLFAIRPIVGRATGSAPSGFPTTPSPAQYDATPSVLRWRVDGHPLAEATFEDVRTIRFRGSAPLSFDTQGSFEVDQWRCWLWRVPPTAKKDGAQVVEFTATPNSNLRFIVTRGTVSLENDAPYDFNFQDNNRRLTVKAVNGEEEWEMSVMERDSEPGDVRGEARPRSFDQCAQDVHAAFEAYARGMCPWSTPTKADRLAAYVMWTSTVRPAGFLASEAVLMSKLWMNKLWSWDNCINGLALASYDLDLALSQILLPFSHITPEGRLPDSMTCSEILYDYTKPPIYGWTFFKLLALLDPSSTSTASRPRFELVPGPRLREIYHSVAKFTRYWFEHRATSSSALPYYSHGNDSGWDNSTAYDDQTVCISPDLAGFLVLQCDLLAQLGAYLSASDSDEWAALRDRTSAALVRELWDASAQAFAFKDAYSGRTWTSTTLLQFMPLVAAPFLPPEIVAACVAKLEPYLSAWGLATERLDSKHYEPDGYWRGPIWAPPTLILESALRRAGHVDMADRIATSFVRLCEHGGFAENYDALTGEGNRDLSYTWSASAYLTLRTEMERRGGVR